MIGLLAQALLGASLASAVPPALSVAPCQFGEAYQGARVECLIEFMNSGNTEIPLRGIAPDRPGDTVASSSLIVPANGRVSLNVSLKLDGDAGHTRHTFRFNAGEDKSKGGFFVRGFVMSVLDDAKPKLDFGVVDLLAATGNEKELTLRSREARDLRITKILDAPKYLKLTISDDGTTLRARVLPSAEWGIHQDPVHVLLNTPEQKEAQIEVKADVHGAIVPGSNPLDLGVMRVGEDHAFKLRLSSQNKKPFREGKLSLAGIDGKLAWQACPTDEPGCRLVELTLDKALAPGVVKGRLNIDLPEHHSRISVAVAGVLLSSATKIKTLDPDKTEGLKENGQSAAPQRQSLKDALHEASKPAAPPGGRGPLLHWTVTNEQGVYGYVIYRSDTPDGPQKRANATTIPVNPPVEGATESTYQWRDTTAEAGRKYWYQITILLNDGRKQDLTAVQEVTSK